MRLERKIVLLVCQQTYNQIVGSLYETRKCYRVLVANFHLLSHYIPDYARMSCTATCLVGHAINGTHVLQEYSAFPLLSIRAILPRNGIKF